MNNLPSIQINQDVKSVQKSKSSKIVFISSSTNTLTNNIPKTNISNNIKTNFNPKLPNNAYDYFNSKIPKSQIEKFIRTVKDEKFVFFLKYGILRRYEGDCEIIYIEIPQIPKKLVVYRRPFYRMKELDKLNLNNKDLPHIPLFESEDKLKYLSLELNCINKIEELISLNNLLYLNLYGNHIKEIENLNGVKKLKILLLGKNNISKIKNLNNLIDLEIIDLHSNKIKYVEGLQTLKKLRILNISNNLLCSFYELIYNRNLEELNVRKNLISAIPTIPNGAFELLKKINIGKNLINKLEFLKELTKIKSLKEIILEYNPILNNPDAITYINKLPVKGKIPIILYKSSIDNSRIENIKSNQKLNKMGSLLFQKARIKKLNSAYSVHNNKKPISFVKNVNENQNQNKICSLTSKINEKNLSPRMSKSNIKSLFNNKINLKINCNSFKFNTINVKKSESDYSLNSHRMKKFGNMRNTKNINDNNNIKINIKLMTINKQWLEEYHDIVIDGYNGYNNKKFKETHIDQGYIEIDGEKNNCLNLYGNCLKILMNEKLYESINILKFNFFCFDLIMSKKYFGYIKSFKNINQFCFNYNNIFSIYQLLKFEFFENLDSIQISNNEICCSGGLIKFFLIYRIEKLKEYNNEHIKEEEKVLSKNIFSVFDNVILQKENEKEKEDKLENEKKNVKENKNNNDMLYNDNDNKIQMWDYVKHNLESAIYIAINEMEEMED